MGAKVIAPVGGLLLAAILLSGLNMRAYLTGMGPVLDDIRAELALSAGVAGLLVALPTLYFGVFSLLVPQLLRLCNAHRLLVLSMVVAAAGVALRGLFGAPGLFLGLLMTSAGVSVAMVIVPAIIKSAYAHRPGLYTSFYTMAFCLGASMGAGLAVPLARLPGSSWQWSLAFWVLPALVAAAAWHAVGEQRLAGIRPPANRHEATVGLYRDPLAWQVTLFMALQSCIGQGLIGWMAVILVSRGMDPSEAGAALSVCLLAQLPTNLMAPWLATRGRDQRLMISLMMAMMLLGVLGVFYAPAGQAWLWVVVMGLGMGGNFALAVSLLVLRSRTPRQAAALSGMAQGMGYTIASVGPAIAGVLFQYSGSWASVGVLFSGLCGLAWLIGMGAGRSAYVLDPRRRTAPESA